MSVEADWTGEDRLTFPGLATDVIHCYGKSPSYESYSWAFIGMASIGTPVGSSGSFEQRLVKVCRLRPACRSRGCFPGQGAPAAERDFSD